MSFTYIKDGIPKIHIFSDDYFSDFKKSLIEEIETNYMDYDFRESRILDEHTGYEVLDLENCKSKQIVYESLCKDLTTKLENLIVSQLKYIIREVRVENKVTFIIYGVGDYLKKTNNNPGKKKSKNTLCMYILLLLQKATEGGETKFYLKEINSSVDTSSDVLFDKSVYHETTMVESGVTYVALFDVTMKLKTEKGILDTIEYLDVSINLYDHENNNTLCYCEVIYIALPCKKLIHAGILINRKGKCILTHVNNKIHSVEHPIVFSSFQDISISKFNREYTVAYIEKNTINDIAWSSIDSNEEDSYLPNDKELFEKLMKISSKEHAKCYEIECIDENNKESDPCYIYCMVSKYYFNLPDKDYITDYIIEHGDTLESPSDDWQELEDSKKRDLLSSYEYDQLFKIVLSKQEYDRQSDESDNDSDITIDND